MRKSLTTALAFIIIVSAMGQTISESQVHAADDLVELAYATLEKSVITESQDKYINKSLISSDLIEIREDLVGKSEKPHKKTVQATEEYTKFISRNYVNDGVTWLVQSGSAVEFAVSGNFAQVVLAGDESINNEEMYRPRFAVIVDDKIIIDDTLSEKVRIIELFSGVETQNVIVKIIHLSEANNGAVGVKEITVNSKSDNPILPTPEKDIKIEFIGDSITCAYGVEGACENDCFKTSTENFMKSYAYLTAQKLNADYSSVCYSGYGIISGYTSDGIKNSDSLIPPLYEKIGRFYGYDKPWNFKGKPNDVVVINLGTNDSSYIGNDRNKMFNFYSEYLKFLKIVRKNNPNSYIICTIGTMGCTELYPYIEKAVVSFSKENGDIKISCYKSFYQNKQIDGVGSDSHPSEVTQQKSVNMLYNRIRDVFKI